MSIREEYVCRGKMEGTDTATLTMEFACARLLLSNDAAEGGENIIFTHPLLGDFTVLPGEQLDEFFPAFITAKVTATATPYRCYAFRREAV